MKSHAFELRPATADDAVSIAALATQVFLDTYATEGIFKHLAMEAFSDYSVAAFAARLGEADRKFVIAESGGGLLGFAEILASPQPAPAGNVAGAELVRLYVQPRVQGKGLGRALIDAAERIARAGSGKALWLTAWEYNGRALLFYERLGYKDVGPGTYTCMGMTYGTRVLAKTW